jgi:hypothetical protein
MAIGPVQLIVLGFEHPRFHGEIIAELERLRESDTVRVIDALAVYKDAEGEIEVEHLSNLPHDEAVELGTKVGALIGLGIEGEQGMEAGAVAGAEAAHAPRRPTSARSLRGGARPRRSSRACPRHRAGAASNGRRRARPAWRGGCRPGSRRRASGPRSSRRRGRPPESLRPRNREGDGGVLEFLHRGPALELDVLALTWETSAKVCRGHRQRYADARGERGLAAFRQQVATADGKDAFAARDARERLAVLDLRVAEAMSEIGRSDLTLQWTRRGIAETDGWRTGLLLDLASRTYGKLGKPMEALRITWGAGRPRIRSDWVLFGHRTRLRCPMSTGRSSPVAAGRTPRGSPGCSALAAVRGCGTVHRVEAVHVDQQGNHLFGVRKLREG